MDIFIEKYERECLIKCLGFQLYSLFNAELDSTQANGLKVGSASKWDDLLNGKTYTNKAGEDVQWLGIRRKALPTDTSPSVSFLANYVFYHYEQNSDVFRSGVGYVDPRAKNAVERSPSQRVIFAWREMTEVIQGLENRPEVIVRNFGVGVDYYNYNEEVTLYRFINDINALTPDTYPNFKPGYWNVHKNQFGI